jgi:hypothetical protein
MTSKKEQLKQTIRNLKATQAANNKRLLKFQKLIVKKRR